MRLLSIILTLMLIANCNRQVGGAHTGSMNLVESIDSRQVTYEGETWIEVTIKQKINPEAPAYVDGIRGTKWNNRLRWSLFKQIFDTDRVTSYFRFRPVGDVKALTLTRDDFEWFPKVLGFSDFEIAIKDTEQVVPSDEHKQSSRASSTDPTAPADAH